MAPVHAPMIPSTVPISFSAGILNYDGGDFVIFAPEYVAKAFHPKTVAFTSIKDNHKEVIRRLAWPRAQNVDQGNLQCRPLRDEGDSQFYASREDTVKAIDEFCQSTASAGVNPGVAEGVYNGKIVSATREDPSNSCPPLDVTSDVFQDLCKSSLMNPIDGCKYSPFFSHPFDANSQPEN